MNVEINPQAVSVSFNSATLGLGFGNPIAREIVEREPYTGEYTVTPQAEAVVLQTNGKRMTGDVTINPIPSNYGLITWNGSYLTVS